MYGIQLNHCKGTVFLMHLYVEQQVNTCSVFTPPYLGYITLSCPNDMSGHSQCICCCNKTGFKTHVSAAGVLLVSCRASPEVSDASQINCGYIHHLRDLESRTWIHLVILFHKLGLVLDMLPIFLSVSFGIPTVVKQVLRSSWDLGNKIAPLPPVWPAL